MSGKHYTVTIAIEEITDAVQPTNTSRAGVTPGEPRKVRDMVRIVTSADNKDEAVRKARAYLNVEDCPDPNRGPGFADVFKSKG